MKYEGEIFKTHSYGDLVITNYVSSREVYVKFVKTGYETVTNFGNIKKGIVRDKLLPSVYGVGIVGNEPTSLCGKDVKEYMVWCGMLRRCYSENCHLSQPTYKDCTTSNNFNYYPYFKEWCEKQVGFGNEGWHLDKDILVKGNKVYSEDTCCFVPAEINFLILKCKKSRGKNLIGVCYHKRDKKYASIFTNSKKSNHLGYFDTEIEAFIAYKEAKESYIKEVANKWKDQIDVRAYNALMNYQVEITD